MRAWQQHFFRLHVPPSANLIAPSARVSVQCRAARQVEIAPQEAAIKIKITREAYITNKARVALAIPLALGGARTRPTVAHCQSEAAGHDDDDGERGRHVARGRYNHRVL